MIDLCACLHSGSVWPFSCKGKSLTKVLQAAASKLWQACYWCGFVDSFAVQDVGFSHSCLVIYWMSDGEFVIVSWIARSGL